MTPYTAAQTLKATPLLNRARLFLDLGGNIWRPDRDPWVYEEMLWLVELHGIRATATTRTEAFANWIKQATDQTAKRASDGRPECPYNGQCPAPNKIPVEA
ncbi:hypothetical protein [Tritonibacter mobilis]|uniref:hypothetical protein n=1 Tax=Tritonibacter mobilis TaxID=379347 RepID=UPI001401D5CB|nr:hypothetical protein [Tritonibacter mobilis]NHM20946.1 hypothetical protein [Tritonibacter mobilis]NHM25100.1 hypothetical protein [Tritonibacter mobilis]